MFETCDHCSLSAKVPRDLLDRCALRALQQRRLDTVSADHPQGHRRPERHYHHTGCLPAWRSKYPLLLLAVAGTKAIFQFLTRWILIGVSREIEFDLRNDLFAHLERLSYSFYQRTRTGDIMARATNDLNAVRMLVGPGIMYTANTVVFTIGALVFML